MRVECGDPVVVAQSRQERHPWGEWQFPAILRPSAEEWEVVFSRTVDDASLGSASLINPQGAFRSADDGRTWREVTPEAVDWNSSRTFCRLRNGDLIRLEVPRPQDLPRSTLPEPHLRDHGYHGFYAIRDPLRMPSGWGQYYLVRRGAGDRGWQRVPAVIDDPDEGIVCYDPPNAQHSVVYGRTLEQVLEMPDGSLLATGYGWRLGADRVPRPKMECYCLRSTDGGRTWRFQGIIARDDNNPLAGFSEMQATVLPDGSLLAVMRTECAKTGPMYKARSTDGGRTWSPPEELWPFGVLPQLLTLENGVTVLSFGRPGAHLLFSSDGKGERWENPVHLVVESFEGTGISGEGYGYQKGEDPRGRPKQTRTSGYTSLAVLGPDSFMIVYDQFDCPNAEGLPRKTILVRRVTVRP